MDPDMSRESQGKIIQAIGVFAQTVKQAALDDGVDEVGAEQICLDITRIMLDGLKDYAAGHTI